MVKENSILAVIRVRGTVGVKRSIAETLKRLNIPKVNNLALVKATKSNLGMVKAGATYITYGEIDAETMAKLLSKANAKASKEDIEAIINGKKELKDLGIKLPIRLHPPRHGYEGIKKGYKQGGALGYRGAEINKLISRML